jgi:hypothetical protein
MTVQVFTPSIQVLLIKLVARKDGVATRYKQAPRQIDLTPYLGLGGAVRTMKNLTDPAGGFVVSFADTTEPTIQDSLYSLIEPMDMIEIRAARTASTSGGQKLPLIMRGFVSTIRRTEGVGQDGAPQRMVVVQGQDAGKFWMINQIYFEIAYLTDQPYLDAFQMHVVTGIDVGLLPVNTYMTQLVQKVMNPMVQKLAAFSNQIVQPFIVDATVPDGMAWAQQGASFGDRPAWALAEMFADRPWNELFVQDQEDGPHLVFRPAPYYDINNNLIMNGAKPPGTVKLDISQVVSIDVKRSDLRVANFFWVPPGNSMPDSQSGVNVASLLKGEPLDFNYSNNNPVLYGVRKMVSNSSLLPANLSDVPRMLPANQRQPAVGTLLLWHQARARQLKLMNRDNSVFEEGGVVVQGIETLQPGKYLQLTRGSLVSQNYIASVAHNFAPLRTWTSELTLMRGTGFLERNKYAGSPSWAEGRKGPYTLP